MGTRLLALVIFVSTGILAAADSRGLCPPSPLNHKVIASKSSAPQKSADAHAGTFTLTAVISDKGYVCDAQVTRGFEDEADKKAAEKAVHEWRFAPARKNGHSVPVILTMEVHWHKDGEHVQIPATPPATQTLSEPAQ
jgi:hypothetical protein